MSALRLVAILCLAEVLGMLSNSTFPALIPTFVDVWDLSNTEAGWVSGVYYGGYIAAVPLLVSLTDRMDPRRIYLASMLLGAAAAAGFALLAEGAWSAMLFRVLGGIGLAGTYMVGAKLLSDRIEGPQQTRAIAWYTAHFGIGSSLSVLAAGEVAALADWRWAYGVAGLGHLAAFLLVAVSVPGGRPRAHAEHEASHVLDVRPVFRNRPALAYILGYAAHVWELFGLRTWIVAFLAFALGAGGGGFGLSPTQLATVILLIGMPASIMGNELAVRFGRRRVISVAMAGSAILACGLGFTAALPLWALLLAFAVYGVLIMADSGALTAGAVAAAKPDRRGATMAVHTLLGFAAGIVGPLAVGVVLDLAGGSGRVLAWGLGFAVAGLGAALGPLIMARVGRRGDPADAAAP